MASKQLSNNYKFILVFSFILVFITKIQALSFKYPTAFTLADGRIFVIHSSGINITNPQYTTSNKILTFNEEITENDLSKISLSKFPTGEYLIFIINKIYVLDENGIIKIETTTLNSITGEYYSMSAHKRLRYTTYDEYYFLFTYIDK